MSSIERLSFERMNINAWQKKFDAILNETISLVYIINDGIILFDRNRLIEQAGHENR